MELGRIVPNPSDDCNAGFDQTGIARFHCGFGADWGSGSAAKKRLMYSL
jgi:hypothetical protein